jgi:membrane protein implicated in regulation of membrane protease activity
MERMDFSYPKTLFKGIFLLTLVLVLLVDLGLFFIAPFAGKYAAIGISLITAIWLIEIVFLIIIAILFEFVVERAVAREEAKTASVKTTDTATQKSTEKTEEKKNP